MASSRAAPDPSLSCATCSAGASSTAGDTLAIPEQTMQDELKELGWEAVRFVAGIAATVIATKIVWHFLNPFRKEEEKAEEQRQYLMDRLGPDFEGREIETDQYEDQIATGLMAPQDIDVTFKDVAGLKELKQSLRELVILPFQRPDLFPPGSLVGPPKGVLLWGPPGTGKTMLAKAIAKETKARFLNVPLSTLQSQWFGESQSLVRATFSLARKLSPCIIFIDEIDSFMRTRRKDDHQAVSDMRAEFMATWDGMLSDAIGPDGMPQHVMVLGTTNKMDEIDPAMMRRMPRRFQVPLPDEVHRRAILRSILANEKIEEGFNFRQIAACTEGYSGSDLKEVCKAGALAPLRDFLERGEDGTLRPLSHEDVMDAVGTVKPAQGFQDDADFQDAQSVDQNLQAFGAMTGALMHQFMSQQQRGGGDSMPSDAVDDVE